LSNRKRPSKSLARRRSHGDSSIELVQSAAIDLGLPVLAAMSNWLPLMLVAAFVGGSRTYASTTSTEHVRAEVEALRRHVSDIRRRVRERAGLTEAEVLELIQRPDVLRLLAVARDQYAVSDVQSRLVVLRAVIVDRASRPHDDLDPDLRLARAALEVPRLGVELVAMMVERGQRDVETRASDEPETFRVVWGQVSMTEFLSRRTWSNPEEVSAAVAAVAAAERHNLILRAEERPRTSVAGHPQVAEIKCGNGARAFYSNDFWWPTPWAFSFIERVVEGERAPVGDAG
jgi:hypothetical protein